MSSYYSYQTNTPRMFTPAEQEQFELARLGPVTPAQQEAFLDYGYEPRAAQNQGTKQETDWGQHLRSCGLRADSGPGFRQCLQRLGLF